WSRCWSGAGRSSRDTVGPSPRPAAPGLASRQAVPAGQARPPAAGPPGPRYTPSEQRGYMAITVATSPGERPSRWPIVTFGSMGVIVGLPFFENAQVG